MSPEPPQIAFDAYSFAHWTDGLIEQVVRDRRSLDRAFGLLLPQIAERIGASVIAVRTFDEDLNLRSFSHPHDAVQRADVAAALETEERGIYTGPLAFCPLDVAGDWFGNVCAAPMGGGPVGGDGNLQRAIEIFGEELDNYLQAIRATREKHRITQALVRALQERVLSDGLAAAVRILSANIGFRRLLIAIRAEQSDDAPVHVEAYEGGGVCTLDTLAGAGRVPGASTLDNHVESEARAYLRGESRQLLDRFGFRGAQEEVLIHGVKETTVVGKVVVEAQNGSFNTHDRDLLASFGAFVCQRVVDFNKEYRTLARSFRADDVDRMLRVSDYVDRYLTPRERTVAMLYVDISGFTRISEQVLVDPARIGRLVDVWGSESVRLVHEHGGVFDKMVGDCVIGLFGPPFYDTDAPERLRCAMRAALAIRKMTADLPEREEFSVLRAEGLAVSTGVHLAPLFVGLFGPNENFTGFSSGMNNTARLQGQAGRNEILVMESAVAQLGPHRGFAFGELREGKAKNVADPLRFLPLIGPE